MAVARQRWKPAALVLGLLVLAGFGVGAWLTWRHDHLPVVDVARWVPTDADALVWTPRLSQVTRSVREVTGQIPGLAGVADAGKVLVGVDMTRPESLDDVGLQPAAGVALFRFDGALWAIIPVADARGVVHVRGLLEKRGYRLVVGQLVTHVFDRTDTQREVALLREDPGVLVLRWSITPPTTQAKPVDFAAYDQAKKLTALPDRPGDVHARMLVKADGPELTTVHTLLGPANLVLGGMIDRVDTLQADVRLSGGEPRVDVTLSGKPGAFQDVADYHTRFIAEAPGALLDVGAVLPDETPLLVRARINPALLAMVPEALRTAFLPPTLLGAWHPALNGVDFQRTVLDTLDGQVALGVLAVADDVPLDPGQWPTRSLRKDLRFFVAASCKTDAQAETLLAGVRMALETSPDKPTLAQFGDWAGFAVPVADTPWWLLRSGRHVLVVSGRGEGEDLQRTASGKFESLAKSAGGGLAQDVLTGRGRWAGALVELPRIVRSLRRRGVPEYVLELLGSIRSVATSVALDNDGIQVQLALQPTRAGSPTSTEAKP